MNDSLLVSMLKSRTNLLADLDDIVPGKFAGLEQAIERLAFDELHRIIGGALSNSLTT